MTQRCLVRIGSRQSALAIRQTELVIESLEAAHGNFPYEIVPLSTQGDRLQSVSLRQIGGKGTFVKNVEQALLGGEIDLAVHSLKDMQAVEHPGLKIAAIPSRGDVRDSLVLRQVSHWKDLPKGAQIATSSMRRTYLLKQLRPDLQVEEIRGNINRRLELMEERQLDGLVLAKAGLDRINLLEDSPYQAVHMDPRVYYPAISQGALAVQIRREDLAMEDFVSVIDHGPTRGIVEEERSFLRELEGNCDIPIGVYIEPEEERVKFYGLLGHLPSGQFVELCRSYSQLTGVGKIFGQEILAHLHEQVDPS